MSWIQKSLLAGVSAAGLFVVAIALPPDLWIDRFVYWPQATLSILAGVTVLVAVRNPDYKYSRVAGAVLGLVGAWNTLPGMLAGVRSDFIDAWFEFNTGPGIVVNVAALVAVVWLMYLQLTYDLRSAPQAGPDGREPRTVVTASIVTRGGDAVVVGGDLVHHHYAPPAAETKTAPPRGVHHWEALCDAAGSRYDTSVEAYLQWCISLYQNQDWSKAPLLLTDSRTGKSVRDELIEWALEENCPRLCVLVGDFGSGKTWLVRWLVANLGRRLLDGGRLGVPVLLPVGDMSLSDLERTSVDFGRARERPGNRPAPMLLLDGVDELLARCQVDEQKRIFRTLVKVSECASRVVATCRTAPYENTRTEFDAWCKKLGTPDAQDRTETAVATALQTSSSKVIVLDDVDEESANGYLTRAGVRDAWSRVKDEPAYRQLSRTPFLLYLLRHALPQLASSTSTGDLTTAPPAPAPGLLSLYRAAFESWMFRDKLCCEYQLKELAERMEKHATSFLDDEPSEPSEIDVALAHAGVIRSAERGRARFLHYSLQEYFVALAIFRTLARYDARYLARLNLIHGYNINRFLVPMMVALWNEASAMEPNDATAHVSAAEFQEFSRSTRWRDGVGYGRWLVLEAADGTKPFGTASAELMASEIIGDARPPHIQDPSRAVTGISWYDAAQCCRWKGGRLPTLEEATRIRKEENGAFADWTSAWFDEARSQIAVVLPSGVVAGMNPDLRSNTLTFRCCL